MRTIAVAIALLTTSSALAASPDPAAKLRSQFYIFDGSSFEAGARGPSLELLNPRQAARFSRLMSLKKDLLQGMSETLKDRSLK